jgi:MBG domain (YGX type)
MRRIWGKRGAGEMKGRKGFRRAGIVLALGVLFGAGLLASGAFGMVLVGAGSTDSTSTATDATSSAATDTDTGTTDTAATSTEAGTTSTDASTTSTTAAAAPTIESDQADYAPGATVRLTGSGWGPGESVHIFVNDDVGQTWQYNGDVTADASGAFTTEFQLPSSFVATYKVTATGAAGETVTTTFTDASIAVRAAPSSVTFSLTYQGFADSTCSTPVNGGNGAVQNAPVSATTSPGLSNNPSFWKFTAGAATAPAGATFSAWSASGGGSFTTLSANVICARGNPSAQQDFVYTATYTTIQNQTITVGTHAPANAAFNSSFTVAATASSGLPVAYSSTGVCTNSGATFTMTAATGTCTVHYNQAGNPSFNPAPEVTESVAAQKAAQTITFTAPSGVKFGDADLDLGATASSGLAVSYASSTTGVCTIVAGKLHVVAAGTCSVTASQAGNSNYNAAPDVTRSFAIGKADQTITFGPLANKAYGDADFALSASASSGLAVSFAASGSCTVSGATVHITGAGSCTITASQAGNSNYNSASDVLRTFSIGKAEQTITFAALGNKTYGDADFTVAASASSGLAVSFAASGDCTVGDASVHITGGGTCTITASQGGNDNYNPAPDVPRTFSIGRADQTITFAALGDKTYGDADFMVAASASSGLAVAFSALGSCTASIGGLVHITGAGSCTITASQAGNGNYNAAASVPRAFDIAKAGQTISFGALAGKTFGDEDFDVSASASSGLTVSFAASGDCTVSGATVHITGAGNCTITASQGGNGNYNAAADVARSFAIAKAGQTITFGALAGKTFGDGDFDVSATASSGLAVSFAASGDCTISGATVHITGAGSCTITASQAGNGNYNAAPDVARSFAIAKAEQKITFAALTDKTYGDADFMVSASASSGLEVAFSALGNCTASLEGLLTITGAGSCTITASQAGNGNYNAAPSVPRTFTIHKADQTISFGALGDKTFGDADFGVSATASSGLSVSFGASVHCTVSGATVHITGAGSCTITASQAGNENYNAAPDAPQTFSIAKANQTISFGALAGKTFGDADFGVSATATSGLTVGFAASGHCSVTGATVHITGAGTCTITASQAGNDDYNAALDVPQTFTIAKADQTISISTSAPASKVYGGSFTVAGTGGGSGNPVAFSSTGACNNSGAVFTMTGGTGSCVVHYNQDGDANYNPAPELTETVAAEKAGLTVTAQDRLKTYGDSDPTFGVDYSGFVGSDGPGALGGSLVFNFAGKPPTSYGPSTAVPMDAGTYAIRPSGLASDDYSFTYKAGTYTINKADQVIAFAALSDKTYGDADFDLTATGGGSGNPVTFATDGMCSVVSGPKAHLTGAGSCSITSSQAGNNNYNAAPDVQRSFSIAKAALTVTAEDKLKTYGDSDPSFTVSYAGFVGSDGPGSLGGSLVFTFAGKPPTSYGPSTTVPTDAGTYAIRPSGKTSDDYTFTYKAGTYTIDKAGQTISFANPGGKTYLDPDFDPSASASSALSVSYSALGNCSIVAGPKIHLTGAGSCTITALQAGNNNYNAAADVQQTFAIAKADQTISFANPGGKTYLDPDFDPGASTSSGLPVSYSALGDCSIVSGPKVHLTGAGSCTITASQPGNANYNAAPDVPRTFAIAKANQTISFANPGGKTYLAPDFDPGASASSGLAVTYAASGNCSIVIGPKVHLTGAGSCMVTASQGGNANYNAAPDAAQTFAIAKANQSITFGTLADKALGAADFIVSATASSGLTVAFSSPTTAVCTMPSATTVHIVAVGSCTIRASQPGNADYNAAPNVDRSFAITYVFHGFFQPVDNGLWNGAQAGSAIPVKFDLSGNQGLSIFAAGYPKVVTVSCPTASATVDPIEETVAASTSGLQYDSSVNSPIGQYIYVWKTDKAWAGTCRRLDVMLTDGTTHSAQFQFKR